MEASKLVFTLACGFIGGIIGYCAKIPAGAMIGAMLGTAVGNWIGVPLERYPSWTFFVLQVILGSSFGVQITKDTVQHLKSIWMPAVTMAVITVLFSILVGWFIHRMTGWDWLSSFFSSAPGGMTDLVLIARGTDADIAKVMVLHMVRLATVILSVPLLLKLFFRF
jgi:membrane AbrB-like protein